ncbi:MAG: (d)CMP kinase, partial [Oscillospiraceae bacterium]|nr:(d)CMP kinase [Oscillospiraceae bacterium]
MSQRKIAVAIDGPAGAGKSTIARAVAANLGVIYVDTGALYRAVGLYGLRKHADTTSADQMLPLLEESQVELAYVEQEQRVLLNGEDVSQAIRVNQ